MNFLQILLTNISSIRILPTLWLIVEKWWWFPLPVILFFPFQYLYLWWIRWEVWYKKKRWILLKIVPPKEIKNPFRGMEDIYSILWGIYDGANWREQWCEGELTKGPFWISFEIASIGGKIHFFMRILEPWKNFVEATLYSHFPDIEISVAEDYTKKVPQDVPNEEWDLYSEDYSFMKDESYPFRTYPIFFEERPEAAKIEEVRIDPLDSMLESMSNLKPAEQVWFQIVAAPITNSDIPWITHGKALANKIAKRPEEKQKQQSTLGGAGEEAGNWLRGLTDAFQFLMTGKEPPPPAPPAPPKREEVLIAPELRLTPGEREVLAGIERKISKQGWKTWIRMVYFYKRKEPHSFGNYKIIRSYFNHFMTENLNALIFWGPTRTRIHYWLRARRLYLRKRKQFRNYITRMPSLFPRTMDGKPFFPFGPFPGGPGIRGTIILNSEELATLYHFPAKITTLAPAIAPIEAKKGGPPVGLPSDGKEIRVYMPEEDDFEKD